MKRLFLLTALILTTSAAAALAQEAAARPVEARVTGDKVHVRTGPGLEHGHLNMLFKFDKGIQVYERRGNWYRIEPPHGPYYISKRYVDLEETTATVTDMGVFLRSGPGKQFEELGKVDRGYKLSVVKAADDWYRVKPTEKAQAWVSADFLEPLDRVAVEGPGPDGDDDDDVPEPADDDDDVVEVPGPEEVDVPRGVELPGETLETKLASFDDMIRREGAKPLAQRDYEQYIQAMDYLKAATDELTVDHRASIKVRRQAAERLHEATRQKRAMLADYQQTLDAIEEQTQERLRRIEARRDKADPDKYLAVGTIEEFGLADKLPPITHKLTDAGGSIALFLFSENLDLDRFAGQRVGIQGKRTRISTFTKPLVEVTGVEALAK
jgi:uncharacterized protein YgiM (DUF1202 family)